MDMKKHIFYSVIGPHATESVEQILDRKVKEVKESGYSLWSAKIDKMSKKKVWDLSPNDEVWVLCTIAKKNNAKDPVNPFEVKKATTMCGPDGEKEIDSNINTTYNESKNYQAYFIGEYFDLRENPININLANYDSTLANGEIIPFGQRFNLKQFQNTYGEFNNSLVNDHEVFKDISFMFKLTYPFVVDIK